ncbi:helix-turn-helix domain-containing protein [Acidovorax sp. NCPPB 3859]|nr:MULTISPECIES: hypothetical protein [unclassified Acidovorax]MDA8450383.1 helix-turn-helix domain-containing protein [Acidovorax sp. GBBC 3297]MDA8459943.1 helix-turn-helix domain-containing protein [Acidovorax sp. GBBC 3333]MDA8464979.1 helix-turn-helix domain-containing protein [Acidovorax sp. GBBC 3332]MDA8469898.1 helix-turn-helix domain-containing protein [Acidovorax sp. GBBC 3299]WCM77505.1 helix-turn-helix domain-containing protein [Acidovorax sp. GBBC 712]
MTQLNSLIEKAASIAGSEYKLAQLLGMQQPTIAAWKSGKRPCSAPDRAALASVAGEDAAVAAVEAVLEGINLETPKGQRAKAALEAALKRMEKLRSL